MKIQAIETLVSDWSGDCLGIGFFEEAVDLEKDLAQLNQRLEGVLQELIEETEFKGKSGEQPWTRISGQGPIRKVVLIGLGSPDHFNLDSLRQAAAALAKTAQKQKAASVGLQLPLWNEDASVSAQAIAEGIELALHQDSRFKSDPEAKKASEYPQDISLLGMADQTQAIEKAQQICAGVILTRELVAAPANVITPSALAETAAQIAAEHGLTLEVLEREECEAQGMGAFLGVSLASDLPPKFIHLTYKPSGTPRRKLAIVGKGVTFDSGGLNLKVSGSGIETMKMDMAGSGATLGAAKAIGQLKPDVEVHFIVAAAENMISGHALHPGDILTASNGKTIEINNTDAEGRLTLADALVFAEKQGVDAIVDLATLTGACIVALGTDIAGMWTPEDSLAEELTQAANQAGEKFWRMPLEDKYFEGLKSPIADMKNTGPRPGGSITAALFLQQYIESTPWAHLDVAGPVWTEKENGYLNVGATGFAVRTLVNWAVG
ncbi:leucyl aminopeptidase [Acaryochloris sp. IP29b_bin.148]|uniref:leucyl aminopeptidase n=1 Tax=Acaryochloris sp. IP29b_bin.148 TaxID=2969218 RepID=UPI0026331F7F|nr:leucyl aminopeptidase [Acaryochloris sp. IP29b_bin.148]